MEHVYLGPEFRDEEIKQKLEERKIQYQRENDIAKTTAELIAQGNIIGWFQGKMEWGPRALGNRSILADPRDPMMRERINRIKGRENFRPICPSILEEKVGEWFECSKPSPFMLFARKVWPDKAHFIPAVVHVGGTARLQTVSQRQNPLFYQFIREFEKITNIPLVVNTSLNYRGKPIVATIDQALECFINSGLDYLIIGSFVIAKEVRVDGFRAFERREDLVLPRESACY